MAHILVFNYGRHVETDVIVDLAIDSFRQLIRKVKFTSQVRNKIAYFYGIMNEKIFQYHHKRIDEQYEAGLMNAKPSPYVCDGVMMGYKW
jgi:hypothetical protein